MAMFCSFSQLTVCDKNLIHNKGQTFARFVPDATHTSVSYDQGHPTYCSVRSYCSVRNYCPVRNGTTPAAYGTNTLCGNIAVRGVGVIPGHPHRGLLPICLISVRKHGPARIYYWSVPQPPYDQSYLHPVSEHFSFLSRRRLLDRQREEQERKRNVYKPYMNASRAL